MMNDQWHSQALYRRKKKLNDLEDLKDDQTSCLRATKPKFGKELCTKLVG